MSDPPFTSMDALPLCSPSPLLFNLSAIVVNDVFTFVKFVNMSGIVFTKLAKSSLNTFSLRYLALSFATFKYSINDLF